MLWGPWRSVDALCNPTTAGPEHLRVWLVDTVRQPNPPIFEAAHAAAQCFTSVRKMRCMVSHYRISHFQIFRTRRYVTCHLQEFQSVFYMLCYHACGVEKEICQTIFVSSTSHLDIHNSRFASSHTRETAETYVLHPCFLCLRLLTSAQVVVGRDAVCHGGFQEEHMRFVTPLSTHFLFLIVPLMHQ